MYIVNLCHVLTQSELCSAEHILVLSFLLCSSVILNTKPVRYLGNVEIETHRFKVCLYNIVISSFCLYLSVGNEHGLERICPYCFQFLAPDTYRVRLKPKMKVTPQIEKILKREAKNHKLNMKQTKLLRKYKESRSVLVRTFICS